MTQETQEPRRDTVSAAVTQSEKWQVQLVVRRTGKPFSELVREHSLADLIEWGERLNAALDALPSSEDAA